MENIEELDKNSQNQNSETETKHEIKSKSLVKFAACRLAEYSRLKFNTDLNFPPSNWLSDKFGLKNAHHPVTSTGFSSIGMANMFLDTIGDVDVISDAENIKRILKLPYNQKSVLSMMIHRVNNTLLIDEFDIHKYLLRHANDDWEWLKSFIYNSMSEQERSIFLRNRGVSRDMLQKLNLQSKFLYYSVKDDEENGDYKEGENVMKKQNLKLVGPRLPDPEQALPKNCQHQHNRNLIWTFEDIKMLIGTDVPIFGSANRPVITLRLKDMAKPINVLTGIDYWLDNLMCNVPEVLMCYHLDGIVQKYELIKTEDLPDFSETSAFSPKLIRNVAQNILAFLKGNATKPGHTYWLFKGKNDDVVKLYDLTTLCGKEETGGKDKSPFTTPVAMLLYTVAKNIRNTSEALSPKLAGRVKSLLENCIKLLPKEKHPQIVTSSYYMLSDLFVPSYIDPKSPNFYVSDEESDEEEEEEEKQEGMVKQGSALAHVVKSLKETFAETDQKMTNSSPPPLNSTDVLERCSIALNHVASGLVNIQFIDSSEEEKQRDAEKVQRIFEEQNPTMANPYQSIPLPFGESSRSKVQDSSTEEKSLLPLAAAGIIKSWSTHLKLILFEKACLVYVTKAEHAYTNECYGASLKYFYSALRCQQLIKIHLPSLTASERKSGLFGRIADCFYQFAKHSSEIPKYMIGFESSSDVDRVIMSEIIRDVGTDVELNLPQPSSDIDYLLETSCAYYEMAMDYADLKAKMEHMRREGSVKNDLGNRYMHLAQVAWDDYQKKEKEEIYKVYLMKSYDAFVKGIQMFREVNDITNLIMVLMGLGRFMRLRAHIALPGESQNDVNILRKFYNEAYEYYQKALDELGHKRKNPELWELITWELSSATFNYAKALQDYSTGNIKMEELEHIVVEALHKSLRLCDLKTPSSRQVLYTFRAGLIHHRLGSLYHNSYLNAVEVSKKKTLLTLCRSNYEKAVNFFLQLKEQQELLEVQLKRISLQETLMESAPSPAFKQKHLLQALRIFYKSVQALEANEVKSEPEVMHMLKLFEQRLQFCLKNLVKVTLVKGQKEKERADILKQMYSETLRKPDGEQDAKHLAIWLKNTLVNIQKIDQRSF